MTADGFKPGSEVDVWLGPDGEVLTVTADAEGKIEISLPIPADTAAGAHMVETLGIDPDGGVLAMAKAITVLALPSTASAAASPLSAALILVVIGLGLIGIAALVPASVSQPRSRRRRRVR